MENSTEIYFCFLSAQTRKWLTRAMQGPSRMTLRPQPWPQALTHTPEVNWASQSHGTRQEGPENLSGKPLGSCNRLKSQCRRKEAEGGEERVRGGKQANRFLLGPIFHPSERSATFPERGFQSSRDVDLWRFTPFPSVKLLAESADWLQQRISHQCSLIVFCKQNACCLVTFHLSLTFPESYCYQIRFTLSSCDYCNLLNPGVHPSEKRKVGCVSPEHGYRPDL